MINNLWGLMCFFINVIAFCEEKKFKENLGASNKYSDYILLRDLRNGHCLQQLWVVIYMRHFSQCPLESSPESQRSSSLVNGCSCSFLLWKSSSRDAERVFQAHTEDPGTASCTGCLRLGAAWSITCMWDMNTCTGTKCPPLFSHWSLKLSTDSTRSTLSAHAHIHFSGSLKYQHDPALCPTALNSSQALSSSLSGLAWGSPANRWICSMLLSQVLHPLHSPRKYQHGKPAQTHNLLLADDMISFC